MECSGQGAQKSTGSDESPREMGGGTHLLQELSHMAAQNTKPFRKRTQDTYGIP